MADEPAPELLGAAIGQPQDEVRHMVHLESTVHYAVSVYCTVYTVLYTVLCTVL